MVAVSAGVGIAAVAMLASRSSLRVEASVESPATADEPTVLEISVCSNSVLPTATDDGRPSWQIRSASSGEVVADNSHAITTAELKRLQWRPRQCRVVTEEVWDGRRWNQAGAATPEVVGTPARGERVAPGHYLFVASWGNLEEVVVRFEVPAR